MNSWKVFFRKSHQRCSRLLSRVHLLQPVLLRLLLHPLPGQRPPTQQWWGGHWHSAETKIKLNQFTVSPSNKCLNVLNTEIKVLLANLYVYFSGLERGSFHMEYFSYNCWIITCILCIFWRNGKLWGDDWNIKRLLMFSITEQDEDVY